MKIDELPENDERLLKQPEIRRDEMGRFEQHGKTLSKTNKKTANIGSGRPGPGRPRGSLNKTTLALREAILAALEAAGGEEGSVGYLRRLAIENSSAFASLLAKVLPTTLQASDSGGGSKVITFQRIIVWPNGHREIEGVTPKQLPPPASPALPNSECPTSDTSDNNDLED